mmetsp:Transcript_99090/g.201030  ORF Transcript_99090/g.201030 Transcript_99090/m.201030 type:complete len:205 (+) Transcript_99090:405-1019(+)
MSASTRTSRAASTALPRSFSAFHTMSPSTCGPLGASSPSSTPATPSSQVRTRSSSWRASWRSAVCRHNGSSRVRRESRCSSIQTATRDLSRTRVAKPGALAPRTCRWCFGPRRLSTSNSCKAACSGILENASRPKMLCSRSGSSRAMRDTLRSGQRRLRRVPSRQASACPRRLRPPPGSGLAAARRRTVAASRPAPVLRKRKAS